MHEQPAARDAEPPAGAHLYHEPGAGHLELVHAFGRHVDVDWGAVGLVRYTIAPGVPISESPRPFAHPICLPNGEIVSGDRPHDHVWHRGLNFGWGYVNDQNFWGGSTYVKGEGYVRLGNNGEMRHEDWQELGVAEEWARMVHTLSWWDAQGRKVLAELRALTVHAPTGLDGAPLDPYDEQVLAVGRDVKPAGYFITVDTRMEAVGPAAPLTFGSPMIAGRPDPSGYGGLTLRMVRDLTRGKVLTAAGHEGEEAAIGQQAPWLRFAGRLDETTTPVTVAAFDHPQNPRHPTRWFVRSRNFPMLGPAFIWNTPYELQGGEPLPLRYGLWIQQGQSTAEQVEAAYRRWLDAAAAPVP